MGRHKAQRIQEEASPPSDQSMLANADQRMVNRMCLAVRGQIGRSFLPPQDESSRTKYSLQQMQTDKSGATSQGGDKGRQPGMTSKQDVTSVENVTN